MQSLSQIAALRCNNKSSYRVITVKISQENISVLASSAQINPPYKLADGGLSLDKPKETGISHNLNSRERETGEKLGHENIPTLIQAFTVIAVKSKQFHYLQSSVKVFMINHVVNSVRLEHFGTTRCSFRTFVCLILAICPELPSKRVLHGQ